MCVLAWLVMSDLAGWVLSCLIGWLGLACVAVLVSICGFVLALADWAELSQLG